MEIDPSQTIGEISSELKEAIPVFERLGIDYCFGGSLTLKDACALAGVPLLEAVAALEKVEPTPMEWYSREPDWRQESMSSLIDYILHVHHVHTRLQLDNIERALAKLSKSEDETPELKLIRMRFLKLDSELRDHLREEEVTIFPCLISAERAIQRGEPVKKIIEESKCFSGPVYDILFEHGMMERDFKEIEKLTLLLHVDGENSLGPLTEALNKLEKDNVKHIHLENNILLKKAAQLGLLGGLDGQ